MNRTVTDLIVCAILALLPSCSKQETVTMSKDLSMCAFILADNDLDDHAGYIEQDLVSGLRACPAGTELFLYVDRQNRNPTLRHLFVLESGQVAVKNLAEYSEQCSTSPSVFAQVLGTMLSAASGRRYGLIFWSHGNGWQPGLSYCNPKSTRAIGADGVFSMDIGDFESVLRETQKPSFVVFDACYMGAVEVAYTLRNSTEYIIASPAETLGVGFPYHIIMPYLVQGSVSSLSHSLDLYLADCYSSDYYYDGTISGMASLTDCSQMDALAASFRQIAKQGGASFSSDTIQAFEHSNPHLYFDFGQYANAISTVASQLDAFNDCLNRAVVHKVTTPTVFTQSSFTDTLVTVTHFSGLSTYIPGTSVTTDNSYRETQWYKFCYE